MENKNVANPEQVRQFLDLCQPDSLAIGIGNAHGYYKGEPDIKLEVLAFSSIGFVEPSIIRDVNPFFNDFMQISKLSPWSRWIAIGTLTLFAHHLHTSTNQSSPEYAPVAT